MKRKQIYLAAVCLFFGAALNLKAVDIPLTLSRPLVQRWNFVQVEPTPVTPNFYGESLYLENSAGVVTSVLLTNGQLLWSSDLGGVLSSSMVADERAVYVASESVSVNSTEPQGVITALGKTSGITIWSQTLTSPIQDRLLMREKFIFGATKDGRIYSFNSETGAMAWSQKYPHIFTEGIILNNQNLIVSASDGSIISIDCRTGKQVWRYRTQESLRVTVAAAGARVFVGSANGYVTALEVSANGIIVKWRRRVGTSVMGLAHSLQGVVAITGDNFVQLLAHRQGARLWKRRMPGRVWPRPLIETRTALFATLGGDACIVLSLDSGKQVNFVSVGEGNDILATPVLTPKALIIPTRRGLMAFGQPDAK